MKFSTSIVGLLSVSIADAAFPSSDVLIQQPQHVLQSALSAFPSSSASVDTGARRKLIEKPGCTAASLELASPANAACALTEGLNITDADLVTFCAGSCDASMRMAAKNIADECSGDERYNSNAIMGLGLIVDGFACSKNSDGQYCLAHIEEEAAAVSSAAAALGTITGMDSLCAQTCLLDLIPSVAKYTPGIQEEAQKGLEIIPKMCKNDKGSLCGHQFIELTEMSKTASVDQIQAKVCNSCCLSSVYTTMSTAETDFMAQICGDKRPSGCDASWDISGSSILTPGAVAMVAALMTQLF